MYKYNNFAKIFILLLLPYSVFSQDNMNFTMLPEYTFFSGNVMQFNVLPLKDDSSSSDTRYYMERILPFGLATTYLSLSIMMREWVYKGNDQDNWWGNVSGALTMGSAGVLSTFLLLVPGLAGYAPGANYDIIGFLALGFIAGAALSFLPPIQQTFRENAFAYYAPPVTLFIISIPSLIEVIYDINHNKKISKKNGA